MKRFLVPSRGSDQGRSPSSAAILAIDPGTRCGYCMGEHEAGVWDLSTRRHEGGGMRFVRFRQQLKSVLPSVGLVAYEEVRRHLGTDAAHVYGGLIAILTEECEDRGIPYTAVPVATVKKLATGKGNAGKLEMVAAAQARWGPGVTDDNEADARWIWVWATETYGQAADR